MRTLLVNVLGWALLAAPIVNAATSVVNNTDPACSDVVGSGHPFCTIQAAVNAARPDDQIIVAPGIYRETVRVLTDGLVLSTQGATINGAFLGGIGVQLLGFQVQGGGIVASTLPGRFNCTEVAIDGNVVNNGDIVIDHCDNASINENVLNGGGISVSFSANLFFFSDNSAFGNAGDGFSLFMSSGAILIGNIARNNGGAGFRLQASDATLKRNRAIGNGENGFEIGLVSFGDLRGNRAIGNRFFGIRQISRHPGDPAAGSGTYKKNKCRKNRLGASSPRGLCKR